MSPCSVGTMQKLCFPSNLTSEFSLYLSLPLQVRHCKEEVIQLRTSTVNLPRPAIRVSRVFCNGYLGGRQLCNEYVLLLRVLRLC